MFLLDVNVVLAAYRADHPDHATVRPWFDRLLDGDGPFTVPVQVWASFLRLVTNRRIFPVPTPRDDAFAFIEAVNGQPHHVPVSAGPRHLALLHQLCDEGDASGDLIPDAVLAAIAHEHHCDVATLDRDFARFTTVRHLRPSLD
ncbi:type II toxin-antitoxin system VapC family toxin [Mycolicibacterium smegmatis]|uniref:type II toxin-antitoxin system VapC family toxin n=1 Tax=Mycolicibacterium smegmatis TaxID=1772 RepID=UPI0005DA2DFA|nr:type II toxin-antitoxin system VapC family toxin [Mycolicibacterium smegmatis]MDF1900772.1 type II toxin-antitoxin system VapC family toxin [Mycolicibacterium smegmatis]MDF1907051.1 type II toxin-antitoxin system VapC family toxin [Mycolicibacterium smegmatis]MDF1919246.1 type II toxin-antitoxin system VapC family toxin [Mycolicibacterium smegmatis]MDF1925313.1 type II toxin-antitoxin system VapC family toxin [Mycolicibacterium smegmatis]UAK52899.1 type II toxin-antitoxin system VapC family